MSILDKALLPMRLIAGASHLPGMESLKWLFPKSKPSKEFTEKDQKNIDAAQVKRDRKAAKRLQNSKMKE